MPRRLVKREAVYGVASYTITHSSSFCDRFLWGDFTFGLTIIHQYLKLEKSLRIGYHVDRQVERIYCQTDRQ